MMLGSKNTVWWRMLARSLARHSSEMEVCVDSTRIAFLLLSLTKKTQAKWYEILLLMSSDAMLYNWPNNSYWMEDERWFAHSACVLMLVLVPLPTAKFMRERERGQTNWMNITSWEKMFRVLAVYDVHCAPTLTKHQPSTSLCFAFALHWWFSARFVLSA